MNERVSECIREVSDGRERVERAAPPVTRGHGLALDGAGLTLGRPKIIAKLSRNRLDFGTRRYFRRWPSPQISSKSDISGISSKSRASMVCLSTLPSVSYE